MADAAEWIAEFKILHEKFRKDELTGDVRKSYLGAREQFARALVSAQGLSVQEGMTARQTFRVAQALQLELKAREADTLKSVTLDLSMTGFSTMMAQPPLSGEVLSFAIKLPGADPISGAAKLIATKKQTGNFRVSFSFERLTEAELSRLETALFDFVLARMAK